MQQPCRAITSPRQTQRQGVASTAAATCWRGHTAAPDQGTAEDGCPSGGKLPEACSAATGRPASKAAQK